MNQYKEEKLTAKIIQCIITVHKILGPGFLESIYRKSLMIELEKTGLKCETEKEIIICYENQKVGNHRLDILVENKIIIELKTVEELNKAHYAQIKSYLKGAGLEIGLLVNFSKEMADYRRVEI
jgi:GxxExxY protein